MTMWWLIIALALLGMSSLHFILLLYHISFDHVNASYIVAITQDDIIKLQRVQQWEYIRAKVCLCLQASNGIMNFFSFVVLLATAVYMLFASLTQKPYCA